ncbi:MAG: class I adenylate-forming enzyme family protein [Acidimicrobiales bacterium]
MHTLVDPLERASLVAPDSVAVICGDHRMTYAQISSRCRKLAGHLTKLGLNKGDRVVVVSANCHRYVESYQAVAGAGFVIVPLNLRASEGELAFASEDSGARVLITDVAPRPFEKLFEHVIRIPDDYEEALAEAPDGELGASAGVKEDDLAGIFYTSGTTGKAKGVMLTHRNLIANAWTALTWARLGEDDRWLLMAPMFHAAGTCALLASTWVASTSVVLPVFDADRALDLIESEQVTATLAVPTMLIAMIESQLRRPREVSSLRLLSHGAAPVGSEVLRRAHKVFPDSELLHLYGTTETAPIATALPQEQNVLAGPRARSCGQPAVGVSLKVVGQDGRRLEVGEVGEVAIRGANVMAGYWRRPEETASVLKDGWYHTGDLGFLDDHSYLFLVDRLKDMIVTGAENVYSVEVEEALYLHDMVLEACVFGVPHPLWGEAVHAVAVTRGDVTAEELTEHCRAQLAGFKVPKQIIVQQESLPRSASGKILKRELREPYWEGRATRIGGD